MNKQTQKNLLNIVKKNYEEISDQFNETRKKYLWPELIKLTRKVKTGDKILDAGCGNGRLLEAFKREAPRPNGRDIFTSRPSHRQSGTGGINRSAPLKRDGFRFKKINYLGVDNSTKLINHAQKRYREQKFIVGDILALGKIPEINFDYVFCVAVLQHIPSKDLRIAALRQLKNKVKPDGKIIIIVWNLWSQAKFRKLILKFAVLKLIKKNKMDFGDILFDWKNSAGQVISRRYYHVFTKRQLKKIIKKAGLKIDKIYKDKYNYYAILKK